MKDPMLNKSSYRNLSYLIFSLKDLIAALKRCGGSDFIPISDKYYPIIRLLDTYTIPEFLYRKYARSFFSRNKVLKLKVAEFTFVPADLFIKGKYFLCKGRLKYYASIQALAPFEHLYDDERFSPSELDLTPRPIRDKFATLKPDSKIYEDLSLPKKPTRKLRYPFSRMFQFDSRAFYILFLFLCCSFFVWTFTWGWVQREYGNLFNHFMFYFITPLFYTYDYPIRIAIFKYFGKYFVFYTFYQLSHHWLIGAALLLMIRNLFNVVDVDYGTNCRKHPTLGEDYTYKIPVYHYLFNRSSSLLALYFVLRKFYYFTAYTDFMITLFYVWPLPTPPAPAVPTVTRKGQPVE